MKIPNIKQPIRTISSKIKNLRIEKHQEEINKYVKIEAGMNDDAYSQIFTAQEMLANYAKAKNVKINIADTASSRGKLISVEVIGSNRITSRENINADTSLILKSEHNNPIMLEDKDGLNYKVNGKFASEDVFLKNLYKVVGKLTNNVSK